jgi:NTE family protein
MAQSGRMREWYNAAHALQALASGRPGMFFPSVPGVWSVLPGMPPDLAVLDHRPLVATLERLVDFERLNGSEVPLMISAVDLESGAPVLFDSRREKLEPRHFLASTAFVPMFPPVELGGRCLGDPGLMANLPIDAVLDPPPAPDLLCFAVDLFDARGPRPGSLDASAKRAQDILFASQSWRTLRAREREHALRSIIRELEASLPPGEQAGSRVPELFNGSGDERITVVLIAYQTPPHELAAKALDFSRASIEERWANGLEDMQAAIEMLERDETRHGASGFRILDCRRSTRQESS